MEKYSFNGKVDQGKIIYQYPAMVYGVLRELNGKDIVVTFAKKENKRKVSALNFYIGIVIRRYAMKSNAFEGNDMDDVIDYFLDRVFGHEKEYKINKVRIVKRVYPSLSGLSESQQNELTERTIQIMTTEYGIDCSDIDKMS